MLRVVLLSLLVSLAVSQQVHGQGAKGPFYHGSVTESELGVRDVVASSLGMVPTQIEAHVGTVRPWGFWVRVAADVALIGAGAYMLYRGFVIMADTGQGEEHPQFAGALWDGFRGGLLATGGVTLIILFSYDLIRFLQRN